jgi:hypothetical protein
MDGASSSTASKRRRAESFGSPDELVNAVHRLWLGGPQQSPPPPPGAGAACLATAASPSGKKFLNLFKFQIPFKFFPNQDIAIKRWRFDEVFEGLQVALDDMQKSIMDLQKFSECVFRGKQ